MNSLNVSSQEVIMMTVIHGFIDYISEKETNVDLDKRECLR